MGEAGRVEGAADRIASLFEEMRPCRGELLAILGACPEPRPVSEVIALVEEMQRTNRSVFGPTELCDLLRRAGALELVRADGEPFEEGRDPEPVEGEPGEGAGARVEAAEPVVAHWVTTEAGREYLESQDTVSRMRGLFDEDEAYLPIYKCILALCAREGGARTPVLGAAVNGEPLLQRPRLFATHFVSRLEDCGALAWRGAWVATETGVEGLRLLADVEDVDVAADIDDTPEPRVSLDYEPLE